MKTGKREEASLVGATLTPKIELDEIAQLISLVEEKNLTHFELEVEGFKIKISRERQASPAPPTNPWATTPSSEVIPSSPTPQEISPKPEPQENLHYITSPMVGTFYRAPDPTSPPFVEVGDIVKKNQTLCIIEAMKLMNEIESDIEGVVQEIYLENGKPVEYGQRLFAIQPIS